MSDTHGVNGEGWIGFDLDGTLAKYDGWQGIDHIGEPIGPMVDLMKKLHGQGRYVKIVTARVAPQELEDGSFGEPYITVPQGDGGATRQYASQYIQDWCHFNLGFVPEIVYQKDCRMLELYDDRVKQVVPNKGVLVEDLANYYEALVECHRHKPVGNAAKLREVYEWAEKNLRDYGSDWQLHNKLCDMLKDALSAPPRNCDTLATYDDFVDAWNDFVRRSESGSVACFLAWLANVGKKGGKE